MLGSGAEQPPSSRRAALGADDNSYQLLGSCRLCRAP